MHSNRCESPPGRPQTEENSKCAVQTTSTPGRRRPRKKGSTGGISPGRPHKSNFLTLIVRVLPILRNTKPYTSIKQSNFISSNSSPSVTS